jgi:hypothetical protein
MIIRDLHVVRVPLAPLETDAILVIDANAVLAFPIASQPLQPVTGWQRKVAVSPRRIQHLQFLKRGLVDVHRDAAAEFFFPKPLGLGIPERLDHRGEIVSRSVSNVKGEGCQGAQAGFPRGFDKGAMSAEFRPFRDSAASVVVVCALIIRFVSRLRRLVGSDRLLRSGKGEGNFLAR